MLYVNKLSPYYDKLMRARREYAATNNLNPINISTSTLVTRDDLKKIEDYYGFGVAQSFLKAYGIGLGEGGRKTRRKKHLKKHSKKKHLKRKSKKHLKRHSKRH